MKNKLKDFIYVIMALFLVALGVNNIYFANHGLGIVEGMVIRLYKNNDEKSDDNSYLQIQDEKETSSDDRGHEHVWKLQYKYDWVEQGDGTGRLIIEKRLYCECGVEVQEEDIGYE